MKLWQWIAILPGAMAALGLLFFGWVWWASEVALADHNPPPRFHFAIPTDPASIARGGRIARTRGCIGCHGDTVQGEVFDDGPWYEYGRTVAPNLAKLAREHDPATLERAIRHGIGHDGRALYSMPSFNFVRMRDDDLAALIAWLRAVPVRETALPRPYLGWLPRWGLATGGDHPVPYFADQVPLLRGSVDPQVTQGEYLAMTSCNECHGFGLRGDNPFDPPGKAPPDLAGAMGYDRAQFFTLMRTGKPIGGRDLRLMDDVARGRFVHWTDAEIDAIYVYLLTLR